MRFSRFVFVNLTSISNADPAVFTATAHELTPGDTLILETTGALPTGLTVDTITYYVIRNGFTANTFQVATAEDGDAVATTSAGSGTHSFMKTNRARLRPTYENDR